MPQVPVVNWRDAVRVFERIGWKYDRTRGSHYIMIQPGQAGLLSIPMHNPIKRGTLRSLIRDAGLTVGKFVNRLR